MTSYDEESTDRLREAVSKAGDGVLTKDQLRWRIEVLSDPGWQEFMSLTPAQAQATVKVYRRQLRERRS